MAKEFSRMQRVSELIRRELATVIDREMDDPRVRFVSVTKVDVSKDLRTAKVYVTQIDAAAGATLDMGSLQKASGFLRKRLADTLTLKSIPALTFIYDNSIERGVRLTRLIEQAAAESGDSEH